MEIREKNTKNNYRFFCRNCQDMITMEACLTRREAADRSTSCDGCSKDTLLTRRSRGMFHTTNTRA